MTDSERLRRDAEQRLGSGFDVRAFHDIILRDGAVSMPMLQQAVERWVRERAGTGQAEGR